jgi:uncharacterized repeat protein (TIGR01451 family)
LVSRFTPETAAAVLLLCASIVLMPAAAAADVKPLYFDSSPADPNSLMSRTPVAVASADVLGPGTLQIYFQAPVTQRAMTLTAGNMNINFWALRNATGGNNRIVDLYVACLCPGVVIYSITLGVAVNLPVAGFGGLTYFTLPVNLAAANNVPVGSTLLIAIVNANVGGGEFLAIIDDLLTGQSSSADFNVLTSIQVDTIEIHDQPYPTISLAPPLEMGDIAYIRATVGDPFGSFDINANDPATQPTIDITDPDSGTPVVGAAMGFEVFDSGVDTKIFEYAYTIPNPTAISEGTYMVDVTAEEGTENAVFAMGNGNFDFIRPMLTLTKSSSIITDPLGQDSYEVPGSVIEYTIVIENNGSGDAADVFVVDPIDTTSTTYLFNDQLSVGIDAGSDPADLTITAFGTGEGGTSNGTCDGTEGTRTGYVDNPGDGGTDDAPADGFRYVDATDTLDILSDTNGLVIQADTCYEIVYRVDLN